MFNWNKKGLIFSPNKQVDWMSSHCQLPLASKIDDSRFKIYFASRNKNQVSQIGWVEIDINDPEKVLDYSKTPVLTNGDLGHFDEHGVFPASILDIGEKKYMYYVGWVRGFESPMFYASIGLAISEDNGETFQKVFKSPILSRSEFDPCMVTSPNVIKVGNEYLMSYVSGINWYRKHDNNLQSKYHIKLATSKDGIKWERNGKILIDFKNKEETNIARPSVIFEQGIYHMWFSYIEKNSKYKMGYATSKDFIQWDRKDHLSGISLSNSGFDSAMTCYPCVFKSKSTYYMVYNGNNFGKDGIGLATCNI